MSERGEVEVLMPLNRMPDKTETRQLAHDALIEARKLVAPTGGRVLGFVSLIRAEDPITSQPALKFRFAVKAPEHNFSNKS